MKEKIIDKKIMTYGAATLILTLLAIVLRTVCLFVSFDAYIGYYKEGILSSVLSALMFISAVYFVSAFFRIKSDVYCSDGRESNTAMKVASMLCALTFVYVAGYVISMQVPLIGENPIVNVVLTVVAVLSAVYFLAKFFGAKSNTAHAAMGFFVVIYSIATIVITYFDIYELLNGPNKLTLHIALISVALFILAEIRAYASELKKGYYVATLTAATFFSGVCSIPMLVYILVTEYNNSYFNYILVTAGLFIYLCTRLVSFVLSSVEPDEEANTLDDVTPVEEEIRTEEESE